MNSEIRELTDTELRAIVGGENKTYLTPAQIDALERRGECPTVYSCRNGTKH